MTNVKYYRRMAVTAMCLPPNLDRKRLVKTALSSALTSLGSHTDHCSEWPGKLAEVKRFLASTQYKRQLLLSRKVQVKTMPYNAGPESSVH